MNIYKTPTGHSIDYMKLKLALLWLTKAKYARQPELETIVNLMHERPLSFRINFKDITFTSFLHYCMYRLQTEKKKYPEDASSIETVFTERLFILLNKLDEGFVYDALIYVSDNNIHCYQIALIDQHKELASAIENKIEAYNAIYNNPNTAVVMNAFNNTNVQLNDFKSIIQNVGINVFKARVILQDGRNMRCAQVLLEQHTHEPKNDKFKAIIDFLSEDGTDKASNTFYDQISDILSDENSHPNLSSLHASIFSSANISREYTSSKHLIP